ncbi:pyridoxal phosphate-dependent aminotransferase [Syntrophomonas palmitatica]|uniref:pyridoxal phosphate-dependent aminotransferase n=1 Tax=Syntrophomonas palmitatica TaxID=402877 RepID=UPI000AC66C68|nr:pyridoxal phosphate-dependent aminotransferase [Syntrophomonas palmitatica]
MQASRTDNISSFIVMDVLEKAKLMEAQGNEIIHLEVGEPDFPTPEPVTEAAIKALRKQDTHYTHSLGKLELREEIAAYYWRKFRVDISPEQILVSSGTSPAMLLVFSVLLEQGREAILPNPYYACYPNFIRFLNVEPVFLPTNEDNGFKMRPTEVQKLINPSTRAVMINSPANPTGVVMSAEDLKSLAALDTSIISDEIYQGLVYEGEEHSILEYSQDAFVINGFSKLFAMTGWRLGYLIAPREYMRSLQKMQQNLFICASSFAQEAGIVALRDCEDHVQKMRATYDQRRRYLLARLRDMGLATRVEPTGAFYALANVKEYTRDSYSFAFEILEKARVAVTPGIDFGSSCEGYIRLSYANSLDNIKEGMDRLEKFLKEYQTKMAAD